MSMMKQILLMDPELLNPLKKYYDLIIPLMIIISVGAGMYSFIKSIPFYQSVDKGVIKFDLNTAESWALQLCGISRGSAQIIIDYRNSYKKHFPNQIVFKSLDDVRKIPHISQKTIEKIAPYLIFPK